MGRPSGAARAALVGAAAALAVSAGAAVMGNGTSSATDVQPAPNAAVQPREASVAGAL
ncbi:hypothetical protein [Rhodococcus tibetensis]|uniref:Uncharacterized protein n=1 Tax=Rhodococcus tibetensis TaxID=2965064 RepID=A0ABT1QAT3_9NOCA|nr:hypothetical protein [Rhodococcus sp. FXJ9.536]MCQ4118240.1 hypothetical protein [Rhodococcus sp. FXJ9.536]